MTETPTITAIAPWFGSKRTLAPRIARELCRQSGSPPRALWELCCGSMAVSLAMPRVSHHTVVDLHGDLVNLARIIQCPRLGPTFYRRLRRVVCHERLFGEAKAALAADDDRKASEAGLFDFEGQGQFNELDPLNRAIAFFIVSWQGRNGVAGTERVNYQPAVRWTSGGGHQAVRFRNAVDSIPAWRRRLRDITILQRDIFDVLPRIEDQDGTSIYVDPPYLRRGARAGNATYLHEFQDCHHHRLARELTRFRRARVVVSYYADPELPALYPGWSIVECTTQKNLHVQNRRGVGRCEAPEVLLINGRSFTDDPSFQEGNP